MMKRMLIAFLAVLCAAGAGQCADTFPDRPIKLIIPFATGGTAEPLARLLADGVRKRTGATVVVMSRPGAGGNIGASEVARADKDGYTLLLGANNNFVVNQFLYPKSDIRPERDFTLISILVDQFQVAYVNTTFPAKTLGEMFEYIKAHPGQVNFASPGPGTAPHLAAEFVSDHYGLRMVHVPYKGGAPAIAGLLAGDVQLYLASLSTGKGQIDSGQLRALAVTAPQRMRSLADVPTTTEAGFPDYAMSNWWGLAAPRGVPPGVVAWIRREFIAALQDAAAVSRLEALGFTIKGSTEAEFADRVSRESRFYEKLIEQRGLAVE